MKVLIVGNGESYNDYDFIRNFDGKILSVDVSTADLIKHDIIPDYQLWSSLYKKVPGLLCKDTYNQHFVLP